MTDKITLILILHNRHKNIDRLLEYYDDYDFPIIVADSSTEKHHFNKIKDNWKYFYTPNLFFTKKLEIVLPQVTTPYVLMCADDDFIIPKSIIECVSFLEANADYAIAQGLSIRYDKDSVQTGHVQYGPIYKESNSIEDDEVLPRLHHFFQSYHSAFYAVFRTSALQQSFRETGNIVKKLFLNEYITAFLPILLGKYKELPILYHVREHAHDSDDKTAIDIDTLMRDKQYDDEVTAFKNMIAEKISSVLTISFSQSKEIVTNIINDFANRLNKTRNNISLKKRLGNLIVYLPLLGTWLIKQNRKAENKNRLNNYFDITSEPDEIRAISKLLIKYSKC